jgi:hypothetical protein
VSVQLKPCTDDCEAWPRLPRAIEVFEETVPGLMPIRLWMRLEAQYSGQYGILVDFRLNNNRPGYSWAFEGVPKAKAKTAAYLDEYVVRKYPGLKDGMDRLLSSAFAWLDDLPPEWPWWTDGINVDSDEFYRFRR